jgi:hypothetical protein
VVESVERKPEGADGSAALSENVDNWLPLVPSIGVLWRY